MKKRIIILYEQREGFLVDASLELLEGGRGQVVAVLMDGI